MRGDALDIYTGRIQQQGPRLVETLPFVTKIASLREGKAIPPREWLYGTMIVRRYVTTVIAPGGVGKTAWSIAAGLSLASGSRLIGDWVHAQTNVLFCNLEDPEDEFDRRVAAFMMHHKMDDEHLAGRISLVNGRDRRLVMASLGHDGMTIVYPDKEAMVASIIAQKIGCIFVDPFVNSHELEENSNPHINAATRAWAEIADETGCAVVLIHHTRKGAVAGDADSGRGAIALIGASRAAFTLTAMDEETAKKFGISDMTRRLHIRLDDAKANLAPPSDKARWFRLASVALGNGTTDYPNGDNVQAVEEWEPPSLWAETTPEQLNHCLTIIDGGLTTDVLYAATKAGRGNGRWAGQVLIDELDVTEEQAKSMIRQWLETGLLVKTDFRDPNTRKNVVGLKVVDSKRPTV